MSSTHDYTSRSALFTDLYELTMAQAYCAEKMDQPAVFELFFRLLPENRNFMVAAGLDDILSFLEEMRFTGDDVDYLRGQKLFSDAFLERLPTIRFTGDVYAVPEGTVVFPNEPLVQVVAPIVEGQLVETYLLNQIHGQSVAASKAARVMLAAQGRAVVEFGSRRSHGIDAALKVSRAAYLVGAVGTSNVLAGKLYGIPIFGTMAHSYIQAHDDEMAAFVAFAEEFPDTTLLVDTYDTLAGVQKVIEMRNKLGEKFHIQSVRLDSGDLAELAKQSRKLLDEAGLQRVKLFASSNLDEFKLEKLIGSEAPIDAFGVGTRLAVAADAPTVDLAYKLVYYGGKPRMKLSSSADKAIFPHRKQVFRVTEQERLVRDVIGKHDEDLPGRPLLQLVMKDGKRVPGASVSLEQAREHALSELSALPDSLRRTQTAPTPYAVLLSDVLQTEGEQLREQLKGS